MLIDCNQCEMRDIACSDCVITALIGKPGSQCEIGEDEGRALRALAEAKLVSPLRLRPSRPLRRAS